MPAHSSRSLKWCSSINSFNFLLFVQHCHIFSLCSSHVNQFSTQIFTFGYQSLYVSTFNTQTNIICMSSLHLPSNYLLAPKDHHGFCAHLNCNSVLFYNSNSSTSLGATWDGSIAFLDWEFNDLFFLYF